jgi:ribonuclease HI
LGLLARDENGHFWVACGIKQRIVVDPTMAEALAALHAVIFAKELGFSSVIFEGDALTVVKAINSKGACESSYGHFVEDVKRYMSELARSSFIHVVRGANSAAHSLAKEACTHVTDNYWWHSIPSCIGGIIREEEIPLLS